MNVSSQMVTCSAALALSDDRPHDLVAGGVAEGVDDPPVAVPALPGEGQVAVLLVELGAPVDELFDLARGLPHHQLDHRPVAQAVAGDEGVFDVVLEPVLRGQHAGDAALGVGTVALGDAVLGDHQHVEVGRHRQGGPQPGQPGPHHQHVGEAMRRPAGVER